MAKRNKNHNSNREHQIDSIPTKTNFDKDDWLKWKLAEYKALRSEVLDAGKNAISILQFGLVAISGLVYVGFVNWNKGNITEFVFLAFCPFICYLILFIWVGEIARRFRASHYIQKHIEDPINVHFAECNKLVSWENWLRGKHDFSGNKRLYKWHRISTIMLFILTAISSISTGLYKVSFSVPSLNITFIFIAEYSLFAIICILLLFVYNKLKFW